MKEFLEKIRKRLHNDITTLIERSSAEVKTVAKEVRTLGKKSDDSAALITRNGQRSAILGQKNNVQGPEKTSMSTSAVSIVYKTSNNEQQLNVDPLQRNKKKVIIEGVSELSKMIKMRSDYVFDIVAFVQREQTSEVEFDGIPIYGGSYDIITELEYDFIFITSLTTYDIMREFYKVYDVPFEKIISVRNVHNAGKQQTYLCFANELYIRGVQGSIAELGVDYGETAKYINLIFNDRKFYLFDTFSGFDERDIQFERSKREMSAGIASLFEKRSNPDDVLSRMYFPENCIIKQGYFPESLGDLEDTFAFVHIDMDLAKPILAALEWFYPRVSKGGIIYVHDFYNFRFTAVRDVVREFCLQNDIMFTPDIGVGLGGAVIIKR